MKEFVAICSEMEKLFVQEKKSLEWKKNKQDAEDTKSLGKGFLLFHQFSKLLKKDEKNFQKYRICFERKKILKFLLN